MPTLWSLGRHLTSLRLTVFLSRRGLLRSSSIYRYLKSSHYLFAIYIPPPPPQCKLRETRGLGRLFTSGSLCLGQRLAQSRCSVNNSWVDACIIAKEILKTELLTCQGLLGRICIRQRRGRIFQQDSSRGNKTKQKQFLFQRSWRDQFALRNNGCALGTTDWSRF